MTNQLKLLKLLQVLFAQQARLVATRLTLNGDPAEVLLPWVKVIADVCRPLLLQEAQAGMAAEELGAARNGPVASLGSAAEPALTRQGPGGIVLELLAAAQDGGRSYQLGNAEVFGESKGVMPIAGRLTHHLRVDKTGRGRRVGFPPEQAAGRFIRSGATQRLLTPGRSFLDGVADGLDQEAADRHVHADGEVTGTEAGKGRTGCGRGGGVAGGAVRRRGGGVLSGGGYGLPEPNPTLVVKALKALGKDPFAAKVLDFVDDQALTFARSTMETATRELGEALTSIRRRLKAGLKREAAAAEITASIGRIIANPARAASIAVTETNRARNGGRFLVAQERGVRKKKWVASGRVCPACRKLNGRTVLLGRPFVVLPDGGPYATVQFPPLHPNCGCFFTFVE